MRTGTASALGLACMLVPCMLAPPAAAEAVCPEVDDQFRTRLPTVTANLSGDQVVPGPGDPDGTGTVVIRHSATIKPGVDYDKEMVLEYELDTNEIAVPLEGAHVHKKDAGNFGIVMFDFSLDADRTGTFNVSKCMGQDILKSPENFYVDVHNGEYSDNGALRGQLQ